MYFLSGFIHPGGGGAHFTERSVHNNLNGSQFYQFPNRTTRAARRCSGSSGGGGRHQVQSLIISEMRPPGSPCFAVQTSYLNTEPPRQREGVNSLKFHTILKEDDDTDITGKILDILHFSGLYPESHGIVGNQFYDQEVHTITKSTCQAFFNIDDERSTAHMKWWQQV